jgi:hypothetical protein
MSNSFTDILTAPGVDLTGRSPSNKVVGEIHTLNPPQYFDRHFLVPAKAPFFAEGVEVYKISTNPLTPPLKLDLGVDYFLSHKYAEASYWLSQDAPPRSLYASISFYDQELVGQFSLTYQTLGGPFALTIEQVSRLLNERLWNPRVTTMEQITGAFVRFPPTDHPTDANTIEFGFTDVNARLHAIYEAIMARNSGATYSVTMLENVLAGMRDEINELKTAINFEANRG